MKKRISSIILVFVLIISTLLTTSCSLLGGTGDSYVTRDELNAALDDAGANSTPGDTININISSDEENSILAASKGLLSAVSVYCNFTVYYSGGYGPSSQKYEKTEQSAGAGVIYQLDKEKGNAYIITNYHVVYYHQSATSNYISNDITVYLYGQEYSKYAINATYIGGSMNYDIAILKVENSTVLKSSNAMAATFSDSNDVSILETAIAIGNPEADGISATVGHINVDSETIEIQASDNLSTIAMRVMRIDAAVNSGNSGGGLYNAKGELIGIVNAKMSSSSVDNIGYAIPSNIVKYVTDNIIYYCDGKSAESVYRYFMGITTGISAAHTEYDTETGKIHKVETVVVSKVSSGAAAENVLAVGDIINSITIDGKTYEVTRTFHVVDVMLNARANSTVVLNITRGDNTSDVTIDMSLAELTKY